MKQLPGKGMQSGDRGGMQNGCLQWNRHPDRTLYAVLENSGNVNCKNPEEDTVSAASSSVFTLNLWKYGKGEDDCGIQQSVSGFYTGAAFRP